MSIDPGFIAAVADGTPPARYVMEKAAIGFDVSVEELTGRARTRPITDYRQVAMAVVRQMTRASYPAIGRLFNRDHTTVMHGVARAERVPKLATAVKALRLEVEREWAIDHGVQWGQSAVGTQFSQVVFS